MNASASNKTIAVLLIAVIMGVGSFVLEAPLLSGLVSLLVFMLNF